MLLFRRNSIILFLILYYGVILTSANPLRWLVRKLTGGEEPELYFRESFINFAVSLGGGGNRGLRNNKGVRYAGDDNLQSLKSHEEKFPCKIERINVEEEVTSVHRLKPSDIKVVAAMGDSLTAGNGALASSVFEVFAENRGVVWSIGGEGDWRTVLTVPNILKEFRGEELIGASQGDGLSHSRNSQLNVADPNAYSWDMLYMAKVLIRRMRSDERIDFNKDWKLITILVGSNDMCNQMCYEDYNNGPFIWEKHSAGLKQALDYLQENLPRTFVNLLITPDVTRVVERRGLTPICKALNYLECPCLYSPSRAIPYEFALETVKRVQQAEIDLVASGRYDVKEDFTVVIQPFSRNISIPIVNNMTDFTYLSQDCFHFSQKGYAWAANALWNNMLEPVGNKTDNKFEEIFSRFLCPTKEHPYFYTARNSNFTLLL